jgi:DUF4097 and DUF4098 domain-containing protein YvlB
MMRSVLICLTFTAAALPAAAQDTNRITVVKRLEDRRAERDRLAAQRRNDSREAQTERVTRTLNIGADGEIDASNISGDIVVTRTSGTSATVEVVKTARGATADEARAVLSLVTVDISERGSRAEIRTRYPNQDQLREQNRRNVHVDVAINIAAPQNARLILKSISGNLNVTDITGGLTLETVSGTVKIANAGRVSAAKSISGDVEVIDTKIDGQLEAGTISGSVRLRHVSARGLTLNSVSGNVNIEDVTCERVGAQTISGNVLLAGDLQPNGRYELNSHSGNVRVALSGNTGFQVEATSFSGTITTDLPLTVQGTQTMNRRQRGLRGTYGNGSAMLDLTTFSGSVVITKR